MIEELRIPLKHLKRAMASMAADGRRQDRRQRSWGTLVLVATCVLLAGCTFLRLKRDLERIETYGWIEGHATAAAAVSPLIVVLYTEPEHRVVDFFALPRAGEYFFVAPPGTYQIAAFEDWNRDFTYEAGVEPAGHYGAPTSIAIEAGVRARDVDVEVPSKAGWKIPLAIGPLDPQHRGIAELPEAHLGTIVKLDDGR